MWARSSYFDVRGLNPLSGLMIAAFMAMLVGAGEFAKHDKETGIYIFPITMLANTRGMLSNIID